MRRIGYFTAFLLVITSLANAQVYTYQADQLADMVGCNTHFYWSGVYSDSFHTLMSRLQELDVRHIRDVNFGSDSAFRDRINQLAGVGIKSDIICEPWWTWPENLIYFKALKSLPNNPVEFIEYPNELFQYPGITASKCISDYNNFYNTYNNDSATYGIPLIGPSFSNNVSGPRLFIDSGGYDFTNKMDYGNLHSYPGGAYAEGPQGGGDGIALDSDISEYNLINKGNKPMAATETGYQLPFNLQWGVTDSEAAKYEPRLLMWYLKKGIKYAYLYQLINDNNNLSGAANNYGILDSNCSRRLSFFAIKNTIKLFNDPGPAFSPATLNYTLSGDTTGIQALVFQKRNGNFLLVLWQPISSGTCSASPYNYSNPPVEIKVTISDVAGGTALAYMPSFDSNSVGFFPSTDTMTINVPDNIFVLEITPSQAGGNAINIYPNPGSEYINISEKGKINSVIVTNLMGQTLYKFDCNSQKVRIDVSAIPAGVYFIRINGIEVRKFVKE